MRYCTIEIVSTEIPLQKKEGARLVMYKMNENQDDFINTEEFWFFLQNFEEVKLRELRWDIS